VTQPTLADLVNEAMAKKFRPDGRPWVDDTLSRAIGLLPGDKGFDAKQVWRLRRGERRNLSRDLVARLIEILGLDPDDAWAASGLLPPEVTAEELRKLRSFRAAGVATTPSGVTDRKPAIAGARILPFRPRRPLLPLLRPA